MGSARPDPPKGFSSLETWVVLVPGVAEWPSVPRGGGVHTVPSPPETSARLGYPNTQLEAAWSLLPPASTGGLRPSNRRQPVGCR